MRSGLTSSFAMRQACHPSIVSRPDTLTTEVTLRSHTPIPVHVSTFLPKTLKHRSARVRLLCVAILGVVRPAWGDCIDDAARDRGVNPYVLRAIGWEESRLDPTARNHNSNGTWDIGAFQINSIHLPALRAAGIRSEALTDGCVSAFVAAWHLKSQQVRFGNTWTAIGAYHSRSPALYAAYANRIAAILMRWGAVPTGQLPVRIEHGRIPPSMRRGRTPSRTQGASVAPGAAMAADDASPIFDAAPFERPSAD